MPKNAWKSWHEVTTLRDDLKSGDLPLHMFAADLFEVLMQQGKRPIYEDPEKFFALTFPTYNLRQLVRDVVLRVAGKNDKAVRQLELTYGGGKTHTLIALRHMVTDPANLPALPAVDEFKQAIGEPPPQARVAGLCFDKLDVDTGMDVRGPDGLVKRLINPWSVLAYQIAGDEGLRTLNAGNGTAERESAPAENVLTDLLELPVKNGLGVLILIDEVLMYVREKVATDTTWRYRMANFFQYLTQAATKVDRCCIVASLLASDPSKGDRFGRQLQGELYDIFQRQREEAVEPVEKSDVAELLRRRFFTSESIKNTHAFRPHVQAALKGIFDIDEQTKKQGSEAEERFLKSFPFHPNLTEVFYSKWTQLDRFQRTRGVLRTFALAIRESSNWDQSPLIGPAAFLSAPGKEGLSEALRELVTVADTEEHEGKKQAWAGIIEGEISRARDIQKDSVGLRGREVEQAVIATFFHSQPIGQTARTRDIEVLIGSCRPDKIELEKGLSRWAKVSFWLDDQHTGVSESSLPGTWRLGNRPNLTQMHNVAVGRVGDHLVRDRLLDEIAKVKVLTRGASAAGVRVHMLPTKPHDINDDGQFHYAVLGPSCASDIGKPNPETKRFLEETTNAEKPRVFRNAVILLAPSKDGLEVALARVRDLMAWKLVNADLKEQEANGQLDPARMQTLAINLNTAQGRTPDAISQAYCTVVTVSEKNEIHAFKINVIDAPHFETIKNDQRSRIQDTPISAEALLPDGPYNLWRDRVISRRVKDLAGAFAQLPHLPKMLRTQAISDTLVDGCAQGAFVLKLARPDGSVRTWWRNRPDEAAMKDPALELVLPEYAELQEIADELLQPAALAELWTGEGITVESIMDYFAGGRVVGIELDGYMEQMPIPKASDEVVYGAVRKAVMAGSLWLINGPASILAEEIPAGILTPRAIIRRPPPMIAAAEILPEPLPDAWTDGVATALSIATSLSAKIGSTLPWKSINDVITHAINARFVQLDPMSGDWPCGFPAAHTIKLTVCTGTEAVSGRTRRGQLGGDGAGHNNLLVAEAALEANELQDLGDIIPELLEIRNSVDVPLAFRVQIEFGDGKEVPTAEAVAGINAILNNLKSGFGLK